MNVSIEDVEAILLERKIDPPKVQEIIKDLEKAAQEVSDDRKAEAGPKLKWEHVIVLHDKDGILKDKEIAGWVVQQKDGEDANLILSKLGDCAKAQNETAKRKKNRIEDLAGLFAYLKPKFTKEKALRIKTKELTRVLITNGTLL